MPAVASAHAIAIAAVQIADFGIFISAFTKVRLEPDATTIRYRVGLIVRCQKYETQS